MQATIAERREERDTHRERERRKKERDRKRTAL